MTGSFGFGIGHVGLLVRFKPAAGAESSLRKRLLEDILPPLPSLPGIGSVHLFEGAVTPAVTNEQRIRGVDAVLDWALLLTGYSEDALTRLMHADLGNRQLAQNSAQGVLDAMYRMEYLVTHREVSA